VLPPRGLHEHVSKNLIQRRLFRCFSNKIKVTPSCCCFGSLLWVCDVQRPASRQRSQLCAKSHEAVRMYVELPHGGWWHATTAGEIGWACGHGRQSNPPREGRGARD
jgi:hypothetical protein